MNTRRRKKELTILLLLWQLLEKKKKAVWVRKLLCQRAQFCDRIMLTNVDEDDYKNYLRMNETTFKELLQKVGPIISKQDTMMRDSIPAEQRLIATLRFLATGRDYEDLKFSCKISSQLLGKIIPETCKAIFEVLRVEYLKFPSTEEEWIQISKDFYDKWDFPNLVGAMDGKHVRIVKPVNSGSAYYNYKKFFSVILFAIVNSNCEFIYVHAGINGRISDSTVMQYTKFYKLLSTGRLNLPAPKNLPNSSRTLPSVFVGDSAFPLSGKLMKPFPEQNASHDEKIFNYRLSRARRVAENAFGILATRFRFYHKPLQMSVDNVDFIILASCALHNFFKRRNRNYMPEVNLIRENVRDKTIINGEFDDNVFVSLERRNFTYAEGKRVQEEFKKYFNNEGKVHFQEDMINARIVANGT